MAESILTPDHGVYPSKFPAPSRSASAEIAGVATSVMTIFFSDKILVTISQNGRLAHWVHVPLESSAPEAAPPPASEDETAPTDLLPMAHLTPTTVLGGTIPERDSIGQLYATQIASAIATKDSDERRTLVVGLGLEKATLDRESFMKILDLVFGCL